MTIFHHRELTHGQGIILSCFIRGYRAKCLERRNREATDDEIRKAVLEFVDVMLHNPREQERSRDDATKRFVGKTISDIKFDGRTDCDTFLKEIVFTDGTAMRFKIMAIPNWASSKVVEEIESLRSVLRAVMLCLH